jgi:hypothetical protein
VFKCWERGLVAGYATWISPRVWQSCKNKSKHIFARYHKLHSAGVLFPSFKTDTSDDDLPLIVKQLARWRGFEQDGGGFEVLGWEAGKQTGTR